MDKKTEEFLSRAPALRKRDIDDINDLFSSYIFLRRKTGEIWTTCCRKHVTMPPDAPIWQEKHVSEPHNKYHQTSGKNQTACPLCGRKGTVKELRYSGNRNNLYEEHRIALLRWDGVALWAQCAWAIKEYSTPESLTDAPKADQRALYRFGKDDVKSVFKYMWYNEYRDMSCANYADFDKETVYEPFTYNADEGMGYAVIGADAIEKSPIKYCCAGEWIKKYDCVIKFIHLAHVYPQKVELLMKAGMERVVWDMAKRGVKHYTVLDWRAADARKAFKVPAAARKEFLSRHTDIGILELWKKLYAHGEHIDMELAADMHALFDNRKDAVKAARRWNVSLVRLYRYLDRQWHCDIRGALSAWKDYVMMAEAQGLPLYRSDVIMPADLKERHDAMVKERNRQLAEERKQREKEQKQREAMEREARKKSYEGLYKKLERKYAWAADGYQIIVPKCEEEIIKEGRILQHCVAGYAPQHMTGKTVILFMRKATAPDKPWLTIEMWGKKLRQIHGYRNEGLYTAKGRIAPDPREQYRSFLNTWLEWIENGSRRKKDGTPILQKTKEAKTA